MKNDKKNITKQVKSIGIVALAFFAGWLLSIPIKSFAAPDMVVESSSNFIKIFNGGVLCVVLMLVFGWWREYDYYVPRVDQWLKNGFAKWRKKPALIENRTMSKVSRPISTVANQWLIQGFRIGDKKPVLIESRTMSTVSNTSQTTSTVGEDTTKNRGVLKLHAQFESSYNRIQETNEKAQKSNMSQKNKDYSSSLVALSDEVLDRLQAISDLGQANAQEIIVKDGIKAYGEKTHKEKAEAKITEIEMALFVLMSEHATKISNDIKSIKLPVSYEIENYLEEVRAEGERLLSFMKEFETPIGTEDEFVLEKIVNERLDELWVNYKHAKESQFEKSNKALDLPEKNKGNPDDAIKEALANIQAIFKEADVAIKTNRESAAQGDLLITKRYFDNRKN